MTDAFARFGLEQEQPTWSSFALEQAIRAGGSSQALLLRVFELLGARAELTPSHAHFVRDFVKAMVPRLDPQRADREWLVERARAALTPAQALLAAHLLPADQVEPQALLSILTALVAPYFDEAVRLLQDSALRSESARHLFANQPELAKRVRAVLSR